MTQLHGYTNEQIIHDLPHLKLLEKEHEDAKAKVADARAQLERLMAQEKRLDAEIGVLKSVTEIFEGVALTVEISSRDGHPRYVVNCPSNTRFGDAYPSAHDTRDGIAYPGYGLNFREYGDHGGNFQGLGWGPQEAFHTLKIWVAHGKKHDEDYAKMVRTRYKLDPSYAQPRELVDAFEAAWLAGHHDLAVELLARTDKETHKKAVKQLADVTNASRCGCPT